MNEPVFTIGPVYECGACASHFTIQSKIGLADVGIRYCPICGADAELESEGGS